MASFEPQDFGLDEPPPRPTTPPVRRGFLLVLLGLFLLTGLVYGVPYVADRTGYAWEAGRSRAASEALAKLDKEGIVNKASALFRMATVAVSPAVVNIQTQRFRRDKEMPGLPGEGGNRFERGLENFGVGSGVIIDSDNGYIVTNNHVINEADRIFVRLSQGREVRARLVGADPKTDLAVLQIKEPLQVAAAWGDSDKLSTGDWVLAIGSPFMLDHTVTAGIVSATRRNNLPLVGMDETSYQDFIQTDAAINPGNSGGPLVDLNGKVVGINTAILTAGSFLRGEGNAPSGGFEGIGLAIPSSLARSVVASLIKTGKVVRGFLGIEMAPITPAMAKAYKLPNTSGAFINDVHLGSPAERAGLKVQDVIVSVNGKPTPNPATLQATTVAIAPGSEVLLEIYRDGTKSTVNVVLAELSASMGAMGINALGFRLRELKPDEGGPALAIDEVARGSPAHRTGLQPGLRILAVGPTEVHSQAEFDKAASAFTAEQGLPLRVSNADGRTAFVTVGGLR